MILLATSGAVALLAIVLLSWLEWRRVDRRHLPVRLAATALAVLALALLGLRPTWRTTFPPPAAARRAVLWTPVASASDLRPPADDAPRFALPSALHLDPVAQPVPDVAFLRRHQPDLGTLRVLGDGLDPAELDALRGLRVEYTAPLSTAAAGLGVRFLRCPRELALGDPLIVQGRLDCLAPGAGLRITLEAPDGTITPADAVADSTGTASFTLRAASPSAAGCFLWHLRLPGSADLPLGVAVVPPNLPRVLVLENAPRFDTAALRRWFGAAGGTLVARTRLGEGHDQFTTAGAALPPPFPVLTSPLLAGFDLLLADARSLLALPPPERDALLAAVADTGLGVLVLPDDALPPPPGAAASPLLPWTLAPLPTDTPGADRPTRVQWPGQSFPTDQPVPTAPYEIVAGPANRALVSDRQGHLLAASNAVGRGQLALTLVRDTARWQRHDDPAAFAAYWSFLFSRLARPASAADAGRWSLREGEAGPVFVDHPLTLLWNAAGAPPPPATVTSPPGTDPPANLALGASAAEPGQWQGTFWPRQAGWHHVALVTGGPALDFYVGKEDAWSALATSRRRTATARAAEMSSLAPPVLPLPNPVREEFPPGWFAALFVLAVGYLWLERRLTQ